MSCGRKIRACLNALLCCCSLFITIYRCVPRCCFIYLVLAYAIANGVPTAIWAYDDTCDVLLIICSHDYHSFVIFYFTLKVGHPHMSNLAIFSCHCYFTFFLPYVNDNNARNKYSLLNYTIWECAVMITTVYDFFPRFQVTQCSSLTSYSVHALPVHG